MNKPFIGQIWYHYRLEAEREPLDPVIGRQSDLCLARVGHTVRHIGHRNMLPFLDRIQYVSKRVCTTGAMTDCTQTNVQNYSQYDKDKSIEHLYSATSCIPQRQRRFLCHRQSGRTTYWPLANPALTDFNL